MISRQRVVVVGGGVAGLVAARALARSFTVILLEKDDAPGGKLATTQFRGRPLDLGPDNFITRNDAAELLCRDLGLGEELLPPASSSAAVFARGRPRPLPAGLALGIPTDLGALLRSGIVGVPGTLRAAADLVLPARRPGTGEAATDGERAAVDNVDKSVAAVVAPRLGRPVLDALVDPLIGGINAGDCDRLSFAAAVPQLAAKLGANRSVIRALRPPRTTPGAPVRPLFLGLENGLSALVRQLVHSCVAADVEIRTQVAVDACQRSSPGAERSWVVCCGTEKIEADGIVLAVPAPIAGRLLRAVSAELAAECDSVDYAGVVTVTLAWPESSVPARLASMLTRRDSVRSGDVRSGDVRSGDARPGSGRAGVGPGTSRILPGSGVLVPRTTGHLVTAASFTSTKWPRSANPGEAVVRVSAGRHGDERALLLDDDELVEHVRADLGVILGITDAPLEVLVRRWPASFPQYATGHLARMARIKALSGALPAFALAGAGFEGIGIPACVSSGELAAATVGDQLRS